jgi:hypothetical protein
MPLSERRVSDSIQPLMHREFNMNKINSLEVVQEQYRYLKEKLRLTNDVGEMRVIIKRLINIVGVMEFLISIGKNT